MIHTYLFKKFDIGAWTSLLNWSIFFVVANWVTLQSNDFPDNYTYDTLLHMVFFGLQGDNYETPGRKCHNYTYV